MASIGHGHNTHHPNQSEMSIAAPEPLSTNHSPPGVVVPLHAEVGPLAAVLGLAALRPRQLAATLVWLQLIQLIYMVGLLPSNKIKQKSMFSSNRIF